MPHSHSRLMQLADALEALGDSGSTGFYDDEVAIPDIVGTVARAEDFDASFTPHERTERWRRTAELFDQGSSPPAVDVVQLGDLFFVRDGHHRISVAKAQGWDSVPARIQRICTVAFALRCLRISDLPTKAAERRFLTKLPLPDDVSRDLWLDDPADWARLADAAHAWGYTHAGLDSRNTTAHDLASAWWLREVQPVVAALRAEGAGTDLPDVQLYVAALAARDRIGALDWPGDLVAGHADEVCCRNEIGLATVHQSSH